MTLRDLFVLLQGVLSFPKEVGTLIRLLQSTPQEKHDEILKRIQNEKEEFEKTGRPVHWN